MENHEPNKLNQNANPDVLQHPQPPKSRFGGFGTVIGGALGVATTALTLMGKNNKTRTENFRNSLEKNPLGVQGEPPIARMAAIAATVRDRFSNVDIEAPVARALKSLNAIRENAPENSANRQALNSFFNVKDSSIKDQAKAFILPEGKGHGIVNTGLRGFAAGIAGTIKGAIWGTKETVEKARKVAFDLKDVKGQKKEAAIDAQIEEVGARFEKDAISAAAKASDTKVGMGNYAKNAGMAIVAGAVVMGATMLVSKFIEKRRESKNMEKRAEALTFEREAGMMNTQTQMSIQ